MEFFTEHQPDLRTRDVYERSDPLPELRIRELTGDISILEKRSNSDSSNGSSKAQSSGGSNLTPIVIGVVVPVIIIAIILFVVWRRRSKIVKQEESHDKYKSLDFGVEPSGLDMKKGNTHKPMPEMSVADLSGSLRHNKGVSMDLGMSNPYILPPELQQSRESLRSLSRSINTGDDKYRATNFIPDDGSIRSPSSLRSGHDSSSIFTGSTKRFDTESKTDLLPRAPMRDTSDYIRKPLPTLERTQGGLLPPIPQDHDRNSTLSTASGTLAIRASNNYLGQYISGGNKKPEPKLESEKIEQPGLMVTETEVEVTPPPIEPRQPPTAAVRNAPAQRESSHYESNSVAELADSSHQSVQEPTLPQIQTTPFEMDSTTTSQFPQRHQSQHAPELYVQQTPSHSNTLPIPKSVADYDDDGSDYYDEEVYEGYEDYLGYSQRASMMGIRPLPPDDPSENPEQRANRIRSFYKEYFDDGSGGSKNGTRQNNYYDGSEQYEEDLYGYYEQSHSRGPSIRSDGRHRAMSHGNHVYRGGPRAYSSMSGRMGPQHRIPKKKLPAPKPLMLLPTPHKLKDDDFLPNAIDFAPPQVFKNQRAGTPDSLRGGMRPYSPSVRAHVPLTSSFDDLAVIPSP